ncbi:MAG: imidazolonepropionase [Planctomycetes bacterium]|nr:imidazolonepropionase [Planctomycetota bacterium]
MRNTAAILAIFQVICILTGSLRSSDEIPGAPQKTPIIIEGATIHPVSSPSFTGALLFDKGRIVALGKEVKAPEGAKKIDAGGKHVFPGFFDAYSQLGLTEINAVRATKDLSESGSINPNVKALVAVNPDSELIPVARANGILLALTAPSGGLVSGMASTIQLDGWTWEDMTLAARGGLYINWPAVSPASAWLVKGPAKKQLENRDKRLRELAGVFEAARAYSTARSARGPDQPVDARLEAMLPVLRGELPVIARAETIQTIQSAVTFAERQGIRLIIHGGHDAPLCAALLKKHEVPVILRSVYRLPRRRSEPYDHRYTLPKRLREAGIEFAISGSPTARTAHMRNLPYHAAMAAAFGLSREEALEAITLAPARILGVAERVGSLEEGKDATLFISGGHMFEISSNVEQAFIQGREVDLSSRHKRLWRKYGEKYRRQRENK